MGAFFLNLVDGMKLRARFLWLMAGIFTGFVLLGGLMAERLTYNVNSEWGQQLVQRQVMFDKYRTLSPLQKELQLARKLAAEPDIVRMAQAEQDGQARRAGVALLEQYRMQFRDHSYFAAFAHSGHYYYNDAVDQYRDRQLRYTLSPTTPADKWFYATLADGRDYQINLDPDVHLNVTKVWINVLIFGPHHEVLGVIGTGLDLTDFLKETVGVPVSGVHNVFINRNMAIQLHNDPKLIDYMSVAKAGSEQIRVDRLLTRSEDRRHLQTIMQQLQGKPDRVETFWVEFDGAQHLLGVSWLPELGWYDLTLINPLSLMLADDAWLILLVFASLFLLSLLLLGQGFRCWVLWPIAALQQAVRDVHADRPVDVSTLATRSELGELSQAFVHMAHDVQETRHDLEEKVRQRTAALQHMAETDPLTGLLNRRGLLERLEQALSRQDRLGEGLGVLLLDLDYFKQVNDVYGHAAGDLTLCEFAKVLQSTLREYDDAARWGGEEFLVVVPAATPAGLQMLAERIRSQVAAMQIRIGSRQFSVTVSVGGHFSAEACSADALLHAADEALYRAKSAGRNCVQMTPPAGWDVG